MSDITSIRTVAFAGPHHAGKTTLVEAVLASCGAIARRGSVGQGTTTTDCEPEAIAHRQSVCSGFAHAAFGDCDFNLIDTPGFIDFFDDAKSGLLAADGAVVVIDAEPARVVQAAAILDYLAALRMPHLVFINKLDRPGADFDGTLAELRRRYGGHVVATHVPIGSGADLRGFVDVAEGRAFAYGPGDAQTSSTIPPELAVRVQAQRTVLLEALADFDDRLFEELMDGIEPGADEVRRDLCAECTHDRIVAVLGGAALGGAGVHALCEAIASLLPSPDVAPRADISGAPVVPLADGPVIAQICKTWIHPQTGKLSVVRVLSGTLGPQTPLVNASRAGLALRFAGISRPFGKRNDAVSEAGPGSIVAIGRLDSVATGETVCGPGTRTVMRAPVPAEPVFAVAIAPREKLDDAKLSSTLARLLEEDPALQAGRAEFTNELLLRGNGEMHVAVAIERLARKYNIALESHPPSVPYRETITADTDVHARYKHQTGGHGQFADIHVRIEARERGHGVTFADAIIGGVVPRQFFPAVERGVREALARGPVAGHPVTDVHVTLYDGSYHPVDSSEAAFRTAGALAIRDGLPKCRPAVLEPLMRVETVVPTEFVSAAIAQLTAKRAQIGGFAPCERAGYECIRSLVPQAELGRYITELRTVTSGFGTFSARHERFELVPERSLTLAR